MLSRIYLMLFFMGIAAIVSCPNLASAQQKSVDLAQQSAKVWLALVDAGKYGEGYAETAQFFKLGVKKEQLQTSLHAQREPLGAVVSRKLKSAKYTSTLPGAPDGNYVVVTYDTSFQHKAAAVETVTTLFDDFGFWRVCGYSIK